MAGDLELWFEAAPGYTVPPECYAAVRLGAAQVPVGPTPCAPHKASLLGGAGPGGPAVVDIFQRVGSISLAALEQGTLQEAAVTWPGLAELRLRVAVVSVQLPEPEPAEADVPEVPSPRKDLAEEPAEAPTQAPTLPSPVPSPRVPAEPERKLYKPISLNNCNQIIPYLYLGGVDAVADPQSLVQQGIRAVCCCCRELEFPTRDFAKELEYYRVDVEDISREPIELFFPEATEFIHSWVSREQPVLVHCRAGVSRSASVVIAYLISCRGYSLHEAFFLVRSHRAIVTPNMGFMEKLGDFEEAKRGTAPTIEIGKYECWYTSPEQERAAVPDLMPD